jgi:hypothetical protein
LSGAFFLRLCFIAAAVLFSLIARAALGLLAAKYFELEWSGVSIDAGGKMKSITRREIAILVVIFMAVPFALWGAISVIDLFLPTSPSDIIAKRWTAGPNR